MDLRKGDPDVARRSGPGERFLAAAASAHISDPPAVTLQSARTAQTARKHAQFQMNARYLKKVKNAQFSP